MGSREVLECCKESLMGNSGGSAEDHNADKNLNSEGQAHEVSDGIEESIGT
jgi:hypothetical protein